MRLILPGLLLLLLSGCGLKDDLYLPDASTSERPPPAAADASAPSDNDEEGDDAENP